MKKFNQLVKELPSNTVVFAFGRFNPPTSGHELLVKTVKKLAMTHNASHAIYASKSQDAKKNPLPVDKKVHYLNLMFPDTKFVAGGPTIRTFMDAAKELNKKYKNLIMVAGSDRTADFEKYLNQYNGKEYHFDSIMVISAGARDPDADDAVGMSASKMRGFASKGDYSQFKKGLPSSMRDIDGRRLIIFMDEFWKLLEDEYFEDLVQNKLKTIRKQNGFLVMFTQSPRDALRSKISHSLVEQTATTSEHFP